LLAVALAPVGSRFFAGRPRVWAARDVPVAFWAWRNDAPSEGEVSRAVEKTRASVLFMRAGQLHYEKETLQRVRAIAGRFPRGIELHLVYNSTRAFLSEFERLDPIKLADLISQTYSEDLARAAQDRAEVAGLQLDLDVPTRLLPHYARIVRNLRERLPTGVKLSVTGLPTWMESKALADLLDAVDFWIPQCYGALIPERLEQVSAISSTRTVARAVERARELNHPFYAGLSAYGYTILYDARGALIALRGDIDPARVAEDANFYLTEREPFDTEDKKDGQTTSSASEWRYVYRARADAVVEGLAVRAGESLMLDVPSAETLRESARAVREGAGEKLLGICIFRLPSETDASTLRLEQVASALADIAPAASTELRAELLDSKSADAHEEAQSLRLTATNQGTTSALMGDDAFVIDVRVPAGSLRAVRLEGFSSAEALCGKVEQTHPKGEDVAEPCAERRANILRLKSKTWMSGASLSAVLNFNEDTPQTFMTETRMQTDEGREWRQEQQITLQR